MTKGLIKAGTPFEDWSSNSSTESDDCRMLYPDNNEGKGVVIPPRSILHMRVEKEEVPLWTVWFVSKAQ